MGGNEKETEKMLKKTTRKKKHFFFLLLGLLASLGQLLLLLGQLLDLGGLLVLAVLDLGVQLLLLVRHHDLGQLLGFGLLGLGRRALLAPGLASGGSRGSSSLARLLGLLVLLGLEFRERHALGLGFELNLVKVLVLYRWGGNKE